MKKEDILYRMNEMYARVHGGDEQFDMERRKALECAKYAVLLVGKLTDDACRLAFYMPEAVNKLAERISEKLDKSILTPSPWSKIPYRTSRVFQSAFCVSCANRDNDPIFAACSVCRSGKNGRPTGYRRETENGENQLGESGEISAKMKWCKKCAFDGRPISAMPCAFCRPRPQVTPTHYKRRRI